ncbi:hypothetical protein CsatB_009854 [Cannabis sativa]
MKIQRTIAVGGLPWSSRPTLSLSSVLMAPPVVGEDGLLLPEDDGSSRRGRRRTATALPDCVSSLLGFLFGFLYN